jgi:acetylglutamate kinase
MSSLRRDPSDTAALLAEALPYIREFAGSIVVVKYGGNALAGSDEATALSSFAEDIVLLHSVGIHPVVVHGGGPQIGEMLVKLGKEPEFRDGQRVTDAETLEVVRMVLIGKVNSEIVGALNVHGPLAVGISGVDANLIEAGALDGDLGFVGGVTSVNPTIIERLIAEELIPVIATVGSDAAGQSYNINADTVAGAIAAAVGAEKLVFLTDVQGLRSNPEDPESLLARIDAATIDQMIASGAAAGGMIPKAEACALAVRGGVRAAHILDGRVPHALLVELFTDGGVGTMVTP